MLKNEERRCRTCKRIIVGESKTGICPECARKGKNILVNVLGMLSTALLVFNKERKK